MLLKSLTNLILVLAAVRAEYQVLEKRDNPPDGFSRIGSSPADKILSLRLALAQNDISGLHDTVYDVESFVVPSEDTVSQVNSWLESHNLTSSPITAAGTGLLKLKANINAVYPTVSFMASPPTSAKPAANVLGVSGFDNDFANKRDLKEFRPDMNPNTTFDLISIDSGINSQLPAGAGLGGGKTLSLPLVAGPFATHMLNSPPVALLTSSTPEFGGIPFVGATEFTPDETTETASSLSGGGFSNYFKRPKFQDAVVPAYLKAIDASSSAPFNVLAVARIAAKKPGLGWLNPLIYQNPAAFKDLATGLTHACNDIGFNSTVGWDPVTGLGSPSYTKLQEFAASCSMLGS
ncbi:hypothetical protein B0H13DRAFT_1869635 [Mycena leptocephala]|nr:hypothetical protein B0H13DRAFT_1869635 [Mycena leptocephala]